MDCGCCPPGHKIEIAPTSQQWYVSDFHWSTDGKWLAYNRALWPNQQGSNPDLGTWVVSADGKRQFRISVPIRIERFELIGWRPDRPEVYVSEGYPYTNRNLWLCDLKGNAHKLGIPSTYPTLVNAPRRGKHICVRTLEREGSNYFHHVRTFTADGAPALDLGLIDTSCDAKNGVTTGSGWPLLIAKLWLATSLCIFYREMQAIAREVIAGYGREPTHQHSLVTDGRPDTGEFRKGVSSGCRKRPK